MTRFINSAVFQIWLACVAVGIGLAVVSGDLVWLMVYPWVGAFAGILYNELKPGFVAPGLELVAGDEENDEAPTGTTRVPPTGERR